VRRIVSIAAVWVVASLAAQSVADTIIKREHAKMFAERTAEKLSAFYLPTYTGVGQRGQAQTAGAESKFQTLADPQFMLEEPLTAHVYQSAAVVTGVQVPGGVRRVRFVRVWVRDEGTWKIALHQGSAVGEQQPGGTPVISVPNPISLPVLSSDEAAVLRVQEALWAAYQQHDVRTYERSTAPEFVGVTALGEAVLRDEWLKNHVARSPTTRAVAAVDDVKVRIFDDLAVITCRSLAMQPRGTAASAARIMTIFARKNGAWQQVHTQSTMILQSAQSTAPISP
jgi:hypothetical protein